MSKPRPKLSKGDIVKKHSPGPWRTDNSLLVYSGTQIVATVKVMGEDRTADANAHLVAAAPDLLKELRMLLLMVCGDDETHVCNKCRMAKFALAKAEGGEM